MNPSVPRPIAACLLAIALVALPASAQVDVRTEGGERAFESERTIIETALGTVVRVLEEATLQHGEGALGASLRGMAEELTASASPFARTAASDEVVLTRAEVDRLVALLRSVRHQTAALMQDAAGEDARRLSDLHQTLDDALALVESVEARLPEAAPLYDTMPVAGRAGRDDEHRGDGWELSGEETPQPRWTYDYDRDEARAGQREIRRYRSDRHAARSAARAPFDMDDDWGGIYVGASQDRNPFREDALYRGAPALRYNRVEGFVLGAALPKLDWYDSDRAAIYGQVGYAFALEEVRYTVGLEVRPGRAAWRRDAGAVEFKLGGAYRRNTATNDLWKSSWFENTAAALLFEHDFFDYYQVEGWTVYGLARLGEYTQASLGYRDEDYSSLERNASFSVFDGDAFRFNPVVDELRLRSVVSTLEAGRILDWYDMPLGGIVRGEAEFGQGLGGDAGFNRFTADARAYLPVAYGTGLALRLRGGYASDDAPIQKQFTVGGLGTSRGYAQNIFVGTRALVANAELTFDEVDLSFFDDIQLFGFADLAWTNRSGDAFDLGETLPTAGIGLGLADRYVRFELAFPLRNVEGTGVEPALWFRLLPTF
jgi:hypothetical protein